MSLLGSQKPAEEPPVVARSTTRLVQLTVVVHDTKGKPVTDLQKGDFIVEDEGKPQEIRFFSVQSRAAPAKAVAPVSPGVFSNRRAGQTGVAGGVTIILLDGLNTRWGDQAVARKNVTQYLLQIQPRDRVALYALGKRLSVLHDYTEEPAGLLSALQTYLGENTPDLTAFSPVKTLGDSRQNQRSSAAIAGIVRALKAEATFALETRVSITLRALEAIANHLAGVPGRKNLVWVSGGFPLISGHFADESNEWLGGDWRYSARIGGRRATVSEGLRIPVTFEKEFDDCIRALNAADLAVYPADARGMTTNPQAFNNISTMRNLAAGTGGKAYYYRNDLMNSIREAVEDSVAAYSLAYYPSEQNLDGRFRRIKVKVDRPGVSARHRQGYFDANGSLSDGETKATAIREAVWSPLDATAVGLEARLEKQEGSKPEVVLLRVKVDPAGITLHRRGGRWVGQFDVALVQTDEKGNDYGAASTTVPLDLPQQAYETIRTQGLIFSRTVRRHDRATALRVIVRDSASGDLGRVIIPFGRRDGVGQ